MSRTVTCPYCGSENVYTNKYDEESEMFICSNCGKNISEDDALYLHD